MALSFPTNIFQLASGMSIRRQAPKAEGSRLQVIKNPKGSSSLERLYCKQIILQCVVSKMVWKWFVTNKHATSSNGGLAAEIPSQLPIKYANLTIRIFLDIVSDFNRQRPKSRV